jgi:hypothetical protein
VEHRLQSTGLKICQREAEVASEDKKKLEEGPTYGSGQFYLDLRSENKDIL